MGKTKEEMRKYKREWDKMYRLKNPEYRRKQNERSARNNAKKKEGKVSKIHIDISGERFGRLIVVRLFEKIYGDSRWLCKCDCGEDVVVRKFYLVRGDTKSCGCLFRDVPNKRSHGEAGYKKTREYRCWADIKTRCTNRKQKSAKNYVDRGIKMCDKWFNSFQTFLEDVGRAPSKKHTIDRYPDKNGNYELGNVRWATAKQQCNNKTNNVCLEHNGVTKTVMEWSTELGIEYFRFYNLTRRNGLSIKDVINLNAKQFRS